MALFDGCIGRWSLADSIDSSGYGFNLSTVGSPAAVEGHGGTADVAAGLTGGINGFSRSLLISPELQAIASDDFTIALWVKPDDASFAASKYLVGEWSTVVADRSFMPIFSPATNKIKFITSAGSADALTATTKDVWTHYIFEHILSSKTLNIYKNTVADGSFTYTGTIAIPTTAGAFTIGDIAGQSAFDGSIDDVAAWSRVLTSSEKTELFALPDDFGVAGTSLSITSPLSYAIYQRGALNTANISISGNCVTGAGTGEIEARFNGGVWETIVQTPVDGAYNGTLTAQQAGQGDLEVRFSGETTTTSISEYVSVGEIFMVCGQSNAECHLTNLQSYSHGTLKPSLWKENSSSWGELIDPTDKDKTTGSVYPLLATLIMAELDIPVGFITVADGATTLSISPYHWKKGGTSYEEAVTVTLSAAPNGVRAMLWFQGEAEALAGSADKELYQIDVSQMLDDFQTDLSMPDLKMIMAQLGDLYRSGQDIDPIRMAQADRWENDPDILHGPVLYDIDLSAGDWAHFQTDAEGQLLAERWWHFINAAFFNTVIYPGPKVISTMGAGTDSVTITFDVGESPLQGVSATGWAVSDDTGALTISSAVLYETNKVILTLNRVLESNPKISFGAENTGAGSLFRDSSSVPGLVPSNTGLPAEPFVSQDITFGNFLYLDTDLSTGTYAELSYDCLNTGQLAVWNGTAFSTLAEVQIGENQTARGLINASGELGVQLSGVGMQIEINSIREISDAIGSIIFEDFTLDEIGTLIPLASTFGKTNVFWIDTSGYLNLSDGTNTATSSSPLVAGTASTFWASWYEDTMHITLDDTKGSTATFTGSLPAIGNRLLYAADSGEFHSARNVYFQVVSPD